MKLGTLLGALAGGIIMFLTGYLFFGFLFADFFMANSNQYPGLIKDPPNVLLIFLFNLVWAWIISFVMEYSNREISPMGGAILGAVLMFAIALGMDIEYEAFMNIHKSFAPLVAHMVFVAVMGALAGTVIAVIQQKFNR
ncbi:MAG: hypothetical protein ABL984_15450 [Pyrinomonadaceae bacterium]